MEHEHPHTTCITMCKTKNKKIALDALENPILMDNLDTALWNDKCDHVDIESCENLNLSCYNLIVMQLNVRGLFSNQKTLNQLLRDLENKKSKVDLVLLCETFLNKHTLRFVYLPGYTLISNECTD